MANKKYYRAGGQTSLLTSLQGGLDMTMPGATNNKYMKGKDCGCSKKMQLGGGTHNTYFGKK